MATLSPLHPGYAPFLCQKYVHLNDGLYDFSGFVTPLALLLSRREQPLIACPRAESHHYLVDVFGQTQLFGIRGDYACML